VPTPHILAGIRAGLYRARERREMRGKTRTVRLIKACIAI